MVGKPVELVVDGVNGLVDIAVAEERTLLAGAQRPRDPDISG